jgi:hypothetical protein
MRRGGSQPGVAAQMCIYLDLALPDGDAKAMSADRSAIRYVFSKSFIDPPSSAGRVFCVSARRMCVIEMQNAYTASSSSPACSIQ